VTSEADSGAESQPSEPVQGLGVTDFASPGVRHAVTRAISLLPPGKRRLLLIAAGLQMSLGVLDLVGIALIGLVAAVAVSGIGVTSIPARAQVAVDALGLGSLTVTQLSALIALSAVAVLVLKTILSALLSRRIIRFLASRQAELSSRLAQRFLKLPIAYVTRWTTSEATYALNSGVGAATVALLGSSIMIAAESFLFILVGVSLFIFDPLLTLGSAVFFGITLLVLHRVLGRVAARNARVMTDASIDTLSAVSEALATYRESTVLHRRDMYVSRYEQLVSRSASAGAANAFIVEVPKYALEIALYFGVLVIGFVQFLTKDWGAAAATVAVFLAAGSRVTPAMLRLQGAGITARNSAVQAQPTFFMDDFITEHYSEEVVGSVARVTAQEIAGHVELGYPGFSGNVELVDVSFEYLDADSLAVDCVSMSVGAGTSVALVGPTGAGKSTLADIILGVLIPSSGLVTVGGLTPREAICSWPGAITYVPQSVALVHGSVRQNVALGLPREVISDDLVWEALERAHLAEYLTTSREGLDTFIGERGFKLSGGQRQRLGLARALYTKPRLLVLDEATSSLDTETESAIIRTLDGLEGEVTTVTIAHRLATVRRADQVFYLNDGRVQACGSFDDVRGSVLDFDRQAFLSGL